MIEHAFSFAMPYNISLQDDSGEKYVPFSHGEPGPGQVYLHYEDYEPGDTRILVFKFC